MTQAFCWIRRVARTGLLSLLCAGAGAPAVAAPPATPVVTRYGMWMADGHRAGGLQIEARPGGEFIARFEYKDNGRGPDTVERYRLDTDGTPLHYEVRGTTTYGSQIHETFELAAGRARWRSEVDRGEVAAPGGLLYGPLGGSPAVDGLALAALARRADRTLPLAPEGTLRQQVLDRVTVTQPSGQRLALQLLAHVGQGFEPTYLWATEQAPVRLFAQIIPGSSALILEGWQSTQPVLAARQKKAETLLMATRARQWLKPLPGLTVVRNARVFDSEQARLGPASDVYVYRGRITAVVPAGSMAPQAPDTQIDAAGRVMLPGLFDMHDHAWRGAGGLHLAAGVTTVRDMGSNNTMMAALIDEISAGQLAYPQVVPAGFIEGDSPFAARADFVVKTLDDARRAIDWYAQRGYPQLKVYNSFPKEILRETVAYAHQRGLRVSGHVPVFLRAEDVIDMGFDEIQHINQLLLNFLVTPTTDTRTLDRFVLPAERLGELDLDSEPVQAFIRLLKQRGTVVDLTLMTFMFIQQQHGEDPAELADVLQHLPPDQQRSARMATMKIPDAAAAQRYRAAVAKMIDFAGRLYRAGVPLVAGTDHLAGFVLHSELIGYVQAGLTPAQAIQVATLNGARYTGTLADRGRIAPGMRADLLLVDGEPTERIADIRRVALVITQGRWLAPREVHQSLGIKPFVEQTPVVSSQGPAPAAAR